MCIFFNQTAYQSDQCTFVASKTSDSSVVQLNKQTNEIKIFTCNVDKLDQRKVNHIYDDNYDNNDNSDKNKNDNDQDEGKVEKEGLLKSSQTGYDYDNNEKDLGEFAFEKQLFQVTMQPNEYEIIRVDKFEFTETTKVHKQCYDAIHKSLKQKYKNNSNVMETLEQTLFHATDWETISKIEQHGFNRDYNKRSKYGKGVYFAKYAKYSDSFARKNQNGEKCMLVCNVIAGKWGKGWKKMSNDEQAKYDSLVDNQSIPQIFVIAKDYHCIPICTIVYKAKNKRT